MNSRLLIDNIYIKKTATFHYYKNKKFLKLDPSFDDLSKNFIMDQIILCELANILNVKDINNESYYLNALFISGNHKKNI